MSGHTPTYWLSMHVPYACRHAGVCCTSGWDIPIERARVAAASTVRPTLAWLQPVSGADGDIAGVLGKGSDGRCVFHDGGCAIHRAHGHAALPSACQHFPRQVLLDPRGVFVSLSHYCPTAADLLFSHEGPVEIVEGPSAVPDGQPEGLDARHVLPPLLADGVLMDWEGYGAWEARMLAVLTSGHGSPEVLLGQVEEELSQLQRWRPGGLSLAAAVVELSRRGPSTNRERPMRSEDAIIGRYLASRAFASWAAFGPRGAVAVLTQGHAALATLRSHRRRRTLKDAIRQTDFELIHQSPEVPPSHTDYHSATTGP